MGNVPINLTAILNLITCYKYTDENSIRIKELKSMAEIVLSAIAKCGDGRRIETAFIVISTGNEFTLLNYLEINLKKYIRSSKKLNTETILDV